MSGYKNKPSLISKIKDYLMQNTHVEGTLNQENNILDVEITYMISVDSDRIRVYYQYEALGDFGVYKRFTDKVINLSSIYQ